MVCYLRERGREASRRRKSRREEGDEEETGGEFGLPLLHHCLPSLLAPGTQTIMHRLTRDVWAVGASEETAQTVAGALQ